MGTDGRLRSWRRRLFARDPDRSVRRVSDVVAHRRRRRRCSARWRCTPGHETAAERSLARFVAELPAGLRAPLSGLYTLAVLWAIGLVVAALLVGRRWRLARDIAIAGVLAWIAARLLGTALAGVGLGDALDALTKAGASPRFPLTRVAIVTAAVVVASPHLTRPMRRVGQATVGLLTVAALFLATALPGDLLAAIVLGWAAAAAVHLAFGVPMSRPSVASVRDALARLGVTVDDARSRRAPTDRTQRVRRHRRRRRAPRDRARSRRDGRPAPRPDLAVDRVPPREPGAVRDPPPAGGARGVRVAAGRGRGCAGPGAARLRRGRRAPRARRDAIRGRAASRRGRPDGHRRHAARAVAARRPTARRGHRARAAVGGRGGARARGTGHRRLRHRDHHPRRPAGRGRRRRAARRHRGARRRGTGGGRGRARRPRGARRRAPRCSNRPR